MIFREISFCGAILSEKASVVRYTANKHSPGIYSVLDVIKYIKVAKLALNTITKGFFPVINKLPEATGRAHIESFHNLQRKCPYLGGT